MHDHVTDSSASSTLSFLTLRKLKRMCLYSKKTQRMIPKTSRVATNPLSKLPNVLKLFEKNILDQLANFYGNVFSSYQFGFSKRYSVQQCLIALVELEKMNVDN